MNEGLVVADVVGDAVTEALVMAKVVGEGVTGALVVAERHGRDRGGGVNVLPLEKPTNRILAPYETKGEMSNDGSTWQKPGVFKSESTD